MSDQLAERIAAIRRQLEDDRREAAGYGDEPPPPADPWQMSEPELAAEMSRLLERLHALLPPEVAEDPPEPGWRARLRHRLALRLYRLLTPISGPQRHLNALLIELGLAAYVRQRRQQERQDELATRTAELEEDLALLAGQTAGDRGDG